MARAKGPHYVSNSQFYKDIIEYYIRVKEAEESKKPLPQICPKVLDSIIKICNKLANSSRFNGYSYKQDMIAAGIEKCFIYHKNFNIERSNNPFSYFTQIAFNAFRQILKSEKQQQYVKKRIVDEEDLENKLISTQGTDDAEYTIPTLDFLRQLNTTDFSLFEKPTKKKEKIDDTGI